MTLTPSSQTPAGTAGDLGTVPEISIDIWPMGCPLPLTDFWPIEGHWTRSVASLLLLARCVIQGETLPLSEPQSPPLNHLEVELSEV